MSVVLSHPTGNEFSKAVLKGFYNEGILQSYYTTVASFPGTFFYNLGSFKLLADIKRRCLDKFLKTYVHTYPWKEIGRQISIKANRKKLIQHETGFFSVDAVYNSLDNYVSRNLSIEKNKGATAIYAYEDGAYQSFKKAKELNLKCIYDLPIGYWRSMHEYLSYEKKINPEWACTIQGLNNSEKKLNKKDAELNLSDAIVVASSFTLNTLNKFPGKLPKVQVVPYAFPSTSKKEYQHFKQKCKLKLLFVGGLSQRKGLSYLFDAVNGLEEHVSLTIVGRGANADCKPLIANLKKHKWISSLPHQQILQLMKEHDVLIFPSLFEGFGLVITEAMSQGTPVITTERTAGPDIINHNENGWLINAGSSEEIKITIEKLLLNPGTIEDAGRQALHTATERNWEMYGEEIALITSGITK